MSQADIDLAFAFCLLTGLGVFVCRLVLAMWSGRTLEAASIAAALALGVLAVQALPRSNTTASAILVAGAAETRPFCTNTDPALVDVSGSRVRITGHGASGPDCGVWAVVLDPRTELHWVQGPAVRSADGWTLDLVVGMDDLPSAPLSYRVFLLALAGDAHDLWASVALGGSSALLIRTPPPDWLPPGLEVAVGG